MDNFNFFSLASGSSGNCYYIGNDQYGILFDVGIGPRTIRKRLKDIGVGFEQIRAVFITHDHFDHVKSTGIFSEKLHIPIYTTKKVHEGINANYGVTQKVSPCNQRKIENGESVMIGEFKITSFPIPHDSHDNTGYMIEYRNKCFTIATDIGHPTDELCQRISQSNYLIIEANHDEKMLKYGNYPAYLKQRVAGDLGHLSNRVAGELLGKYATEQLCHVFLCHLSKQNNTPELAYQTVIQQMHTHTQVTVLARNEGMLFHC